MLDILKSGAVDKHSLMLWGMALIVGMIACALLVVALLLAGCGREVTRLEKPPTREQAVAYAVTANDPNFIYGGE